MGRVAGPDGHRSPGGFEDHLTIQLGACLGHPVQQPGCDEGDRAAGGTSGTTTPNAASASLPTVTLMVGGIDKQIYLPYQLAQDLGFYKKYGVNVQLSTEQNGGVGAETVDAPDAETECPVGVDTQASRLLVLNR